MLSPVSPTSPVAPWLGGKRNLAKRICAIIDNAPCSAYAEPFVGMGGVFLRRAARPRAEVINDRGRDIAKPRGSPHRRFQPVFGPLCRLRHRLRAHRTCPKNPRLYRLLPDNPGYSHIMALHCRNACYPTIGKTVRTAGEVHFGEAPLLMDLNPDLSADSVLLIAKDAYGRVVTREDIGTGKGRLVEWFGLGADGTRLPPGIYSFMLESYRGDSLLGQQKLSTYSTLQELQQDKGEITFALEGGATVSVNEINGLKQGSEN
ncbi:MAG: FlgD immunoglobulin-like domain containing protein [Paracoccus sp. (in: a-proteobacteria)]